MASGVSDAKQVNLTKQERIHRALRERILSGEYGPGYRLVIDAIADEFEISTLPVREAIRRLEAEGLVVFEPHAGAQVTPADPGAFDDGVVVLGVLEGFATALAAPHLRRAELREMKAINRRLVEALQRMDYLEFGRLNREFHAVIHEHCPNPALITLLHGVERRLDAIRQTVFVQVPSRGAVSVTEHEELMTLIADRAPAETIETAAREHKLRTLESFRAWRREHGV